MPLAILINLLCNHVHYKHSRENQIINHCYNTLINKFAYIINKLLIQCIIIMHCGDSRSLGYFVLLFFISRNRFSIKIALIHSCFRCVHVYVFCESLWVNIHTYIYIYSICILLYCNMLSCKAPHRAWGTELVLELALLLLLLINYLLLLFFFN